MHVSKALQTKHVKTKLMIFSGLILLQGSQSQDGQMTQLGQLQEVPQSGHGPSARPVRALPWDFSNGATLLPLGLRKLKVY